ISDQSITQLTFGNKHHEFRLGPNDAHGSTDFPSISPDGRKVAYISRKSGSTEVWTMNIDGSDQKQVTTMGIESGRAVWSSDGQSIRFIARTASNAFNLFSVEATGDAPPYQLTDF